MSDKMRRDLLAKLEGIIGNSCYNGNIQNWGANGAWLGEGREYRYPITFSEGGTKLKRYSTEPTKSLSELRTGRYEFGANHLYIIRALDQALDVLESEYGLRIGDSPPVEKSSCPICERKVGDIDQHVSQAHPDQWAAYATGEVLRRLEAKKRYRCPNCGSFLKSLDGHDAKCPALVSQ